MERVVIKVGTSSITMGGSTPSSSFMDTVAEQIAELKNSGKEVLIVSSGAVGIGLKAMNAKPKPNEVPIKQAAASVGQGILMQKWNDSFQKHGINVAQILITLDDYSDRDKVLNLNNTISTLLDYNVVPIFNENDAISTKEIGPTFGDNDTLSAVIASRADADLLVILSDVSGLYDSNPKDNPDAKLIPVVNKIDDTILSIAGGPGTKMGTGGMKTKIKAAKLCQDAGCMMIIASSAEENVILRTVNGDEVGTLFTSDSAISKKRRWMKSARSCGKIVIDEGAMKAVQAHRSLLPVGVKFASGPFEPGKVVDIVCNNEIIAKGIPDYGSEDINRVRGMRSEDAKCVLGTKMKHKDVIRSENIVQIV
ncbi:MAG: glutamate 5-kinase [archaeon]|nr:glutamate 5-kinase [archaeon]